MATGRSAAVVVPPPEPVPIALTRALVDVAKGMNAPLPVYAHLTELLADPSYGEPGSLAANSTTPPEVETRFWENVAADPALRDVGIQGPHAASQGAFGTVELATSTAATVAESLATLGSFSEVLHGVSIFSVAQRGDGSVAVLYEAPHAREGRAAELAAEFALSSVVEMMRRHVGDDQVAPRELHLRGSPVATEQAIQDTLRCAVRPDAASDRLEIAADVAKLPLRTGAPHLHDVALRLCRLERAALLGDRVTAGVRWALREVITERAPLLDAVATLLGTRPRTMQARLTAEGISFRELVDEARRSTVERMLVAGAPPREIQAKLGYADAASLRRACRRWWGVGPTGRARALGVGKG